MKHPWRSFVAVLLLASGVAGQWRAVVDGIKAIPSLVSAHIPLIISVAGFLIVVNWEWLSNKATRRAKLEKALHGLVAALMAENNASPSPRVQTSIDEIRNAVAFWT
jgi:hypothetical protein